MTLEEAKELKRGTRVRLNNSGIAQGLQGGAKSLNGEFLKITRDALFIRVRRDGIITPDTYSPSFWDVA